MGDPPLCPPAENDGLREPLLLVPDVLSAVGLEPDPGALVGALMLLMDVASTLGGGVGMATTTAGAGAVGVEAGVVLVSVGDKGSPPVLDARRRALAIALLAAAGLVTAALSVAGEDTVDSTWPNTNDDADDDVDGNAVNGDGVSEGVGVDVCDSAAVAVAVVDGGWVRSCAGCGGEPSTVTEARRNVST